MLGVSEAGLCNKKQTCTEMERKVRFCYVTQNLAFQKYIKFENIFTVQQVHRLYFKRINRLY